jgi:phosphoenolpyruvate phosphomutase
MKCIILAAGRGTRIKKISKNKPKCLIKINNISILERQINFLRKLRIKNITVITGYKRKQINFKNIQYILNKDYKNSEQLESLFCAKKEFNEDMLITFGDTIYDFSDIRKLSMSKKGDIVLGIDRNWRKRYIFRHDHPYEQADKVKVNKKGKILKIGKKLNMGDANAEFLGVLKLSKRGCEVFNKKYSVLKNKQKTQTMQIHDFIREIIKTKKYVQSCNLRGKFMEIDTLNDYKIATKLFAN